MVPQASAQSCAVGSPARPARTARPRRRPRGGRRRGRRRTGPCRSGRGSVGACRRPRSRRRCRRGAGRRRRTRPAPARPSCRARRSRCGRRRRRAGGDRLDHRQRGPGGHRRHQAEVGRDARRGVQAVRRDAAPDQVEPRGGAQDRGRGVGEVPHLGPQPGGLGDGEGLAEGLLLGVVGGVLGLVAAREVRPDPGDPPVPGPLAGARRRRPARPSRPRGAAAGQPGVDLELQPRRTAGGARPGAISSSSAREYAVTSTSAAIAAA